MTSAVQLTARRDHYPAKLALVAIFCCPACGAGLERDGQVLRCENGHAFDVARRGYVNLLLAQHRRSADPGYSKAMITSRHEFFAAGHYHRLADGIADLIIAYLPEAAGPAEVRGRVEAGTDARVVLDAGCGEGYYLRCLRERLTQRASAGCTGESGTGESGTSPAAVSLAGTVLAGVDVSKHGIRLAARDDPDGQYAVASSYRIPVPPGRVSVLLSHFSPVSADDFLRAVAPGGVVLVGGPGADHLFSVKELVYATPARHVPETALAAVAGFELIATRRIQYPLELRGPGQVGRLLRMTPYFWSAGPQTQARLAGLDALDTEVDVIVQAYRRSGHFDD
jgi:23S rRNA (guanine745-N1)-methyltransferase